MPRFHLDKLAEADRAALNLAWHRLDAWPDVPPGLARLKRRYWLAPVSNVLGSEIADDYKPKPRVYLAAAEAFDLSPSECMMVAAHTNDLMAAAKLGLRAGHIARPNEHGSGKGEAAPKEPVDVAASSLEDLAAKLGV